MKTVGVGAIGVGRRIGGLSSRLQKACPDVKIVAVSDTAEDRRQWARENLNPDCALYTDYRELVKDEQVDWVMVGSWNCFHREHAVAAFEAGKDVFCEKPLATNIEDCLAIRDAWQSSGRKFSMGFTLRYSPHYRRIRELLDEGRVGKIISLEFNETLDFCHGGFIMSDWRRFRKYAGTHMLEKCCHDLDIINWMTGSRALRVASFGGLNLFRPEHAHFVDRVGPNKLGKPAYQTWFEKCPVNPFESEKDAVDNQVAIIEYENGVRASFHANSASGIPERRLVICGTEGAIRGDVFAGKIECRKIGFDAPLENVDAGVSGGHGGGDSVLVNSLVDCMVKGAEPFTGVDDGLKSAFTAFAIDEAMDTGRVVDVAPYWEKAGL